VILIAYDESEDGQSAIDVAGGLLGAEPTIVLSVWEPLIDVVARTGVGVGPGVRDFEALDNADEESARERAAEAAQRVGGAGLNAEAHTRARQATIAATMLAEAQEAGARARLCSAPADLQASSHCSSAASPTPCSSAPTGRCSSSCPLRWCTRVRPAVAEQISPGQ
jgi:hypothetical protein